jgi:hypothetical protein
LVPRRRGKERFGAIGEMVRKIRDGRLWSRFDLDVFFRRRDDRERILLFSF